MPQDPSHCSRNCSRLPLHTQGLDMRIKSDISQVIFMHVCGAELKQTTVKTERCEVEIVRDQNEAF